MKIYSRKKKRAHTEDKKYSPEPFHIGNSLPTLVLFMHRGKKNLVNIQLLLEYYIMPVKVDVICTVPVCCPLWRCMQIQTLFH